MVRTARIVFDGTEMFFYVIRFRMSGEGFEFFGASYVVLLLHGKVSTCPSFIASAVLVRLSELITADWRRNRVGDRSIGDWKDRDFVVGTRRDTRQLESVLNGTALFTRMTTFRNFCIVSFVQEGCGITTIGEPYVKNRNLCVVHTLSNEFGFNL